MENDGKTHLCRLQLIII